MSESTITLTWHEPVSHLGVSQQLVEEALNRGVREHLLEDKEFRDLIRNAIREAGVSATVDAIAAALRDDLFAILKQTIAAQRSELNQCLADYQAWKVQHASEYANRRFKELSEKLDSLGRS